MTVTGETEKKGIYGLGGTVALGYIGTKNVAELHAEDAVIEVTDLTVSAGEAIRRE